MITTRVAVHPKISEYDRNLLRSFGLWWKWTIVLAVAACIIALFAILFIQYIPSLFAVLMAADIGVFARFVIWPLYRRGWLIRHELAAKLTEAYGELYDKELRRIIDTKPENHHARLQGELVIALCRITRQQEVKEQADLQRADDWKDRFRRASDAKTTIWNEYLMTADAVMDVS